MRTGARWTNGRRNLHLIEVKDQDGNFNEGKLSLCHLYSMIFVLFHFWGFKSNAMGKSSVGREDVSSESAGVAPRSISCLSHNTNSKTYIQRMEKRDESPLSII